MTSGARVTIGDEIIASEWDGSDLVALAGLTIRWGRADVYGDPDPSLLTLELIDRQGTFLSDSTRIGQPVRVEQIDPARTVFRGAIAKPTATRTRLHNPLTNQYETVWVVTLTAADPLASLGMAVYVGDAIDGWIEGAGGWSEVPPNTRLSRLWNAGASSVVGGFEPVPDIAATPPVARRMHGEQAADARNALELVAQAYRGVPLGVVGYDPHEDMVRIGTFTNSASVDLVREGSAVKLRLSTGYAVPASRVAVSSYELGSSVEHAIDVVQVSYIWYGKDPAIDSANTGVSRATYTEGFIEARTDRYNPWTRRVLKIATSFMTFDPTEFTPGGMDIYNRFPAWLRDQAVAIVNRLNGQVGMPTLTFDAKRMPLPAEIEALIYRPVVSTVPFYFVGSVFNEIEGAGPQFQIIGGTLTYEDGWRHEVSLCATGTPITSSPTLTQLSAHATAILGDVDPDISLADLAYLTTGLPA